MVLTRKMFSVLLPVLLVSTGTLAQSADLDKYSIQYQYRDLPHQPVYPNALTYSVKVVVPGNVSNAIATESIRERCSIEGLRRKRGLAAINVTFTAEDLTFGDITIEEKTITEKDKDGNEIRVTRYYAKGDYSLNSTAKATDSTGMQVYTRKLRLSDTYTSPDQNSRKAASEYWTNNRENIKSTLIAGFINTLTATISKDLNYNFGYPVCAGSDNLWILNARKHPEYAAQQATIATVKEIFKTMSASAPLNSFKALMEPVLAYFESVKGKYTTDDKADKKMRYSSFFNKALIYLYMDMPQQAITEAEGLIANGYDTRDGETLKKQAMELNDLFLKNVRNSRHFAPEANL